MSLKPETVEITIGGKKCELKCTLNAAMTVSDEFGGLVPALQAVQSANLRSTFAVIYAGLGVTDLQEQEEIAEKVYAGGVKNTADPLFKYLNLIFNGGKTPGQAGEGDTVGNPPKRKPGSKTT